MAKSKRTSSKRSGASLLCQRIRNARLGANLTQAAMARVLGVGPSAVAQWEIPDGTSPTVDH